MRLIYLNDTIETESDDMATTIAMMHDPGKRRIRLINGEISGAPIEGSVVISDKPDHLRELANVILEMADYQEKVHARD